MSWAESSGRREIKPTTTTPSSGCDVGGGPGPEEEVGGGVGPDVGVGGRVNTRMVEGGLGGSMEWREKVDYVSCWVLGDFIERERERERKRERLFIIRLGVFF